MLALLERAKLEQTFDDRDSSRFYHSLSHPGLAGQIWAYINDPALNVVVRRMAIEIAGDCGLSELTSNFLGLLRTEMNATIRDYVAHNLEKIVPPGRASELIPLAKGEVGPDADDTIKGCALRIVVPTVWSVSDALPYLTEPQRDNYFGSYHAALTYHLTRHLTSLDLKALLPKMLEWGDCFDSLNCYHAIAEKALVLAIQNLKDKEISEKTAELWRRKSREFFRFAGDETSEFRTIIESNPEARHELVKTIFDSPTSTEEDVHRMTLGSHGANLLVREDLGWLLLQTKNAPPTRRGIWAEAVKMFGQPENLHKHSDLLFELMEVMPEVKQRFTWIRVYPLEDPETRKLKANWLWEKRRAARWARRRERPCPEELIQKALAEIQGGKFSYWVPLCRHLQLADGSDAGYREWDHDISDSPGWKNADQNRKDLIRKAGREFLIRCDDGNPGAGTRTNYSEAGYIAVCLLREQVLGDPELKDAVSKKWIDAITGRFNNGEDHHQAVIALAYQLNSKRCLAGFTREVLDDNQRHGDILAFRAYKYAWDQLLTREFVSLIERGDFKPKSIQSSLSFLATVDVEAAVQCAKSFLPSGIEDDSAQHERTKAVLLACVGEMPTRTWVVAWPIIETKPEFAEYVLGQLAYGMPHEAKKVLPHISERQLADLYLLTNRTFPPEEDPPHKAGFVSPRECVSRFRSDVISELASRGTKCACEELLRLSDALPKERLWLRWRYRDALQLKRRKAWEPTVPKTLSVLLHSARARIVESDGALLELVIESLSRFQKVLTQTSSPEAAFLWNYDGSGNRRHNFRPKDEEDFSDKIAGWLERDLGPSAGVIVGREVQPRRGQKTDIKVVAAANSKPTLTVVIEVKGCWHPEVSSAIKTQLLEDYLAKNGWTHGLYVVGWFLCDKWDAPSATRKSCLQSLTYEGAIKEVRELGTSVCDASTGFVVKGVCLDCRFPD